MKGSKLGIQGRRHLKFDVRSTAPIVLILVTGVYAACSRDKAAFSEVKISQESQQHFDVYDQIKDNAEFKAAFTEILNTKPTGTMTVPSTINVNGTEYKDAGNRLKANLKIANKIFDGSYGQQLKAIESKLGPITARDFQIRQNILEDTLKANGNRNGLKNVWGRYSSEDMSRSLRAAIVTETFAKLIKESKTSSLNLADGIDPSKATPLGAAAGVVTTVIEKLADIQRAINEGRYINASADMLNKCSQDIATCTSAKEASFNTTGQNLYNDCQVKYQPDQACNQGKVRNEPDRSKSVEGSISGYSVPVVGNGPFGEEEKHGGTAPNACGNHKWRCFCTAAFLSKEGGGKVATSKSDYYHGNNDQYSCDWVYAEDLKPDPPQVRLLEEAEKLCQITNKCTVTVTLTNKAN